MIPEEDLAVLSTPYFDRERLSADLVVGAVALLCLVAVAVVPWPLAIVLVPCFAVAAWSYAHPRRQMWAHHRRSLEQAVARTGVAITASAMRCYAIDDLVLDEGWSAEALRGALGLSDCPPPVATALLRSGQEVTCSVFHDAEAGTTHLVSASAAHHDLLDLMRRSST